LIAALAVACTPEARGGASFQAEAGMLAGGARIGERADASGRRYVEFGAPTNFVTRAGNRLMLGDRPYRFTGLNIYNANSLDTCWYGMGNGATLDASLTAIDTGTGGGAKVIRAWFFQRLATADGARNWAAFDHTLAVARAHGFKVVPTLTNQWGDCEQPTGYKTETWYRTGYRNPDPSGTTSYRAFVQEVVARYKDDPTVAFWQAVNEGEAKSSAGGACSPTATQTLRSFADDIGSLIHTTDPNHLVSLGTMGSGQCGTAEAGYQTVHASPSIDLCEYHDYNAPAAAMPGDQWNGLQVRINQCNALGKPLFIGEAGIDPTTVGGVAGRAQRFNDKITAQFAAGVVGYLPWEWRASARTGGDEFVIDPGDPVLGVLGLHGAAPPTTQGAEAMPEAEPGTAAAPTSGIAAVPPMGFNHYNHFGNSVTESVMREIVDAMVANGMRDAGYRYVNIDDSWQGGRDAAGKIKTNGNFPSGIRPLADYVHARGMKLGIYTSPNHTSCGGRTGSAGHVQQDVDSFASWGVDFVKLDWCGADYSSSGAAAIATEWRDAIARTGRPMVLSINAGGGAEVGGWAKDRVHMWRSGDDICASWYNKTRAKAATAEDCYTSNYHSGIYDYIYSRASADPERVGPGHWADPDMLEVGNAGLTFEEARSHFSLWAMWSAPLIAGNDPRAMTAGSDATRILLNPEVIAVDQDPAGVMARKVSDTNGLQVWSKPLADGRQVILLLNATDRAADITATRSSLGLTGNHALRDLWARRDLGPFSGDYTARSVPAHGVVMLSTVAAGVQPCPTAVPAVDHGTVTVTTSVPAAGTYRIASRMGNSGGTADAYLLQVDGGCPVPVGGTALPAGAWTWVDHRDGDRSRKVDVKLAAGRHELKLIGTERGLRLDRVVLTPSG
jgi:alpha-galactosidase